MAAGEWSDGFRGENRVGLVSVASAILTRSHADDGMGLIDCTQAIARLAPFGMLRQEVMTA